MFEQSQTSLGEHSEPNLRLKGLLLNLRRVMDTYGLTAQLTEGPVTYICVGPTSKSAGLTLRLEVTRPAAPDREQLYWSQDSETWTKKAPKKVRKEGVKPKAKKEAREII